jgi:hypothetical protein
MNEIQCRMYRPDGTRCPLAPGHTEEEGPHGEPGVKSTRIPAGEFTFADGITVPFEAGDLTFRTVAPTPREPEKPLDLNFSAIYDALDSVLLLDALAKPGAWAGSAPYTLTVTVTYTRPRNPPIGGLRRWARIVSSTPWRRRSIASWRWLWRRTVAGRTHTMTVENVRIEDGAIRVKGPPDGRLSYDVVMFGGGL